MQNMSLVLFATLVKKRDRYSVLRGKYFLNMCMPSLNLSMKLNELQIYDGMCECVCFCLCVWYTSTCIYVYTGVYIYVCVHACVHMRMFEACTFVFVSLCVCGK